MISKKLFALFILLIIYTSNIPVYATMWITIETPCPISGQEISVHEVVSYGSYIYDAPSKYDFVFWPHTEEEWIWINPDNGYAAFGDSFKDLTDEEKDNLSTWLAGNYSLAKEPNSHMEKLIWIEKVYKQRNMDDDFWCHYYRLMAFMNKDNEPLSLEYVKKALPLLNKKLDSNPEGTEKAQVLFLLGEYNRRLGDTKQAKKYFSLARKTKYTDEEGKIRKGHPYITGLIDDVFPSKFNAVTIVAFTIISILIIISIASYFYKNKKRNIVGT